MFSRRFTDVKTDEEEEYLYHDEEDHEDDENEEVEVHDDDECTDSETDNGKRLWKRLCLEVIDDLSTDQQIERQHCYMDGDDMDYKEAEEAPVDKQKFLLNRLFKPVKVPEEFSNDETHDIRGHPLTKR